MNRTITCNGTTINFLAVRSSSVSVFNHRCARANRYSAYLMQRFVLWALIFPTNARFAARWSEQSWNQPVANSHASASAHTFALMSFSERPSTSFRHCRCSLHSPILTSALRDLAGLTDAQKAHSDHFRKRIRDLESNDPEKLARSIHVARQAHRNFSWSELRRSMDPVALACFDLQNSATHAHRIHRSPACS